MTRDDDPQGRHRQAWDLIPWVVNGTASAADRRLVDEHVAICSDCRDELAFHRELQAGIAADPAREPAPDTDSALAALWSRIDAAPPAEAAAPPRNRAVPAVRWLAAAVVVQAVALAALIGMVWERPHADYVTLSRTAAALPDGAVRLVVAPSLTQAELRALLDRSGVAIVASSGDGAILSVAPTAATDGAQALARLRAEPAVLLAEPIVGR